jgi:hypothetical protein
VGVRFLSWRKTVDKLINKKGETIMTLEEMDRDQLAEYELRRLNFSDDNWRIGHNRESEAPARGAFSTSLTPMS